MEERLLYQDKQFKQREEQYKVIAQQLQEELAKEKHHTEIQLKQNQQQLLESQQQLLQQSQQEQEALVQEINKWQERCQLSQENLLKAQQGLEAKNETLTQMQEKVEYLNRELDEQRLLLTQSAEQKQRLESLKEQLEQNLQQSQTQLQQAMQKLDAIPPQPQTQHQTQFQQQKIASAQGNTRQIEAMYIQLKEQFQEKCAVLDATRRDLFQVNEQLLKYQKEYEEERVFDQSANERHLQRYIVRMGKQFEQMQNIYQQEMDELTQVVDHLLRQMASSRK